MSTPDDLRVFEIHVTKGQLNYSGSLDEKNLSQHYIRTGSELTGGRMLDNEKAALLPMTSMIPTSGIEESGRYPVFEGRGEASMLEA